MIIKKYTASLIMLFFISSLFAQDLQIKELYKKTGIKQRTDIMGGIGRVKMWDFDSLGRFVKSEIQIDGKSDGMTKYYYDTSGNLSVSIDTSLFQYRICKYYYFSIAS